MNELEKFLLSGVEKKASMDTFVLNSLTPMVEGVEPVVSDAEKKNEHELWKKWKESNYNPMYLRPLQDSFKNLIFFHVNKWKSVNIPTRLIQAEAEKQFIDGLKTYNPNKGAALATHLNTVLSRMARFIIAHQNMGRVVEGRAGKAFSNLKTAKNLFIEEFGREPNAQELAQKVSFEYKLACTPNDAKAFLKEDRRDLSIGDEEADFTFEAPANRMLLMMLPAELTLEENQVFERLFGINGCKKLEKGQIAKQLRIHPSKVSRIIASIREKLEKYQ
jgi:DNA-directed RNA polymerase specialized sigma subunit